MSGLVSVVVPVYNGEKYIRTCIDSILGQSYKEIEIIVVHDESSDKGLEILEGYGERIRLIKQGKTNPATARNVGCRAAKGEYVAFCDIDDCMAPEKIERQVESLRSSPEAVASYTDATIIDESGAEISKRVCPEWKREYWLSHRFIVFSSVLIRRAAIEKTAEKPGVAFDESLKGCEDFDFLIRLSTAGPLKRCPSFLTRLRFHSQSLSRNTMWRMNRVRLGIFRKHGMTFQFARSLMVDFPLGFVSEYYISRRYTNRG